MSNFIFRSDLSADYIDDLNALLFFNNEQRKVSDGIQASIEKFGLPQVVADDGKIKVILDKFPDVQCIFAFDSAANDELVGVMLFLRETIDCITLVHIAVKEKYTIESSQGNSMLSLELLYKLKEIAKRLKKVDYLSIYYQKYVAKRLLISK